MLERSSWLPQAKALDVGQRRRVAHDCGHDRSMLVSHEPERYSAWCFRCGDGGSLRKQPTLAERVAARKARQARQDEDKALHFDPSLPMPVNENVQEWPKQARLWLYRAGFHDRYIKELGAYYHEPSQRVVLPVVDKGHVIYWQARAVMPGQVPKYINPGENRDTVLPRYGSGSVVVLTEDILSASKVGRVAEGWSLMGTDLKPAVLAELIKEQRPICIWLDPDAAGIKGSRTIRRELVTLGIDPVVIESRLDPKLLSKQEIKECLQSYFN